MYVLINSNHKNIIKIENNNQSQRKPRLKGFSVEGIQYD